MHEGHWVQADLVALQAVNRRTTHENIVQVGTQSDGNGCCLFRGAETEWFRKSKPEATCLQSGMTHKQTETYGDRSLNGGVAMQLNLVFNHTSPAHLEELEANFSHYRDTGGRRPGKSTAWLQSTGLKLAYDKWLLCRPAKNSVDFLVRPPEALGQDLLARAPKAIWNNFFCWSSFKAAWGERASRAPLQVLDHSKVGCLKGVSTCLSIELSMRFWGLSPELVSGMTGPH